MNILALETSSPSASLCLANEDGVRFAAAWQSGRNHDACLFPALRQAMDTLGGGRLDLILVGAGPGSYGGVRVALAAAVGISAVTGAETVALDSWMDLATGGYSIVSDARRNGWTFRAADGAISILTTEELQEKIRRGALVRTVEKAELMASRGVSIVETGLVPTAEGLVKSWNALTPAQQAELRSRPAEPIYVRPPHITEAKHKPWELSR